MDAKRRSSHAFRREAMTPTKAPAAESLPAGSSKVTGRRGGRAMSLVIIRAQSPLLLRLRRGARC